MKQLATFKTAAEAGTLTAMLDKEKIPYFVLAGTGVGTAQVKTAASGVQVMINDDDFGKAEKLMK
jgi:hypothetical protein